VRGSATPLFGRKGLLSRLSLRLAKGKPFPHPLRPYDLLSPRGQRETPKDAYCVRRIGHRVRHGGDGR
jgi:hypothetical protein